MEKWIADRPHHPGEAAKQWLKELYQDNKLVKGELELGGRKVDLKNITMPVLNVFAKDDHIIPPATIQALKPASAARTTRSSLPGGHVGVRGRQVTGAAGPRHCELAGRARQRRGPSACSPIRSSQPTKPLR